MGNDNPYAALWTLIGAKLFSRPDGTSPLIDFNWSNSVNGENASLPGKAPFKPKVVPEPGPRSLFWLQEAADFGNGISTLTGY
jgi:hypothetical protein